MINFININTQFMELLIMALFSKLAGHAEVGADLTPVMDYLFDNEEVIQSFQF